MGYFGSKFFILKDKKEIEIRDAEISDAASLKSFFEIMTQDGHGQVLEYGEIELTIAQEKNWIKSARANANELVLVAIFEGKIVGLIEIQQEKRRRLNHCGILAMGIVPSWRNRGVGKLLLRELIAWFKEYSDLNIIHLNVMADNQNAIGLYQKFGFRHDGIRRNYIRVGPNLFVDEVLMSRVLSLPLNLNDEPN